MTFFTFQHRERSINQHNSTIFRPEEITILTPYVGQLLKLREALSAKTMIFVDERDTELMRDEDANDSAADSGSDSESEVLDSREGRLGRKSSGDCESAQEDLGLVGSCGKLDKVRNRVRLATVDNFQGEESMVVILSLVRNQPKGRIGFLKLPNRINVMLSRAMHGMYVLGHAASLSRDRTSRMWPEVLRMLEDEGAVGQALPLRCPNHPMTVTPVSKPEDFEALAGDGGCTLQVRHAPARCIVAFRSPTVWKPLSLCTKRFVYALCLVSNPR